MRIGGCSAKNSRRRIDVRSPVVATSTRTLLGRRRDVLRDPDLVERVRAVAATG
jgi:hypothetical protein